MLTNILDTCIGPKLQLLFYSILTFIMFMSIVLIYYKDSMIK